MPCGEVFRITCLVASIVVRVVLASVRTEQLGQHARRPPARPFGQGLCGQLAATRGGLGRIGDRPRIAQHQAAEQLPMLAPKLKRDVSTHRQPDQHDRLIDAQCRQQGRQVIGHRFHRRRAAPTWLRPKPRRSGAITRQFSPSVQSWFSHIV